ncbi:MAG: DNA mismatch repair protein MutS [Saprospiraceae bacterium]|nr:DNA mismatch repair protein MutS [Candidatus Vicinibacter affinis]
MEQYYSMKAKHPDALLLYRVGDFYETFGSDAEKTAQILGIVLTKRNNGGVDVELAGFPYHSLDAYLPKLVRAGLRVAICEQLEKPSKGKKIVNRGITDVITPGVTLDQKILDQKRNNFLAAVYFGDSKPCGVSFADISTGEFYVAEGDQEYLNKLLQNFQPSEVLLPKSKKNIFDQLFSDHYYTYGLEDWVFSQEYAYKKLLHHFEVSNLKGFGVENLVSGQISAGAILFYLENTENKNPKHLSHLSRLNNDDYVWMDRFTVRNLELLDPIHPEGKSLLNILDESYTPMGSRHLRKWLSMPLLDIEEILARQSAVEYLLIHQDFTDLLKQNLKSFGDLERLVSKIPLRRINPRELKFIQTTLAKVDKIKFSLSNKSTGLLHKIEHALDPIQELFEIVEAQIIDEAPHSINKGGIIKDGFNEELDDLRYVLKNSKDLLLDIQKNEAINTGINNLKIGYNSVFGYFLEVTNKYKNMGMVPEHWIRKQTMSTGERYVTDELKKLESKILGAEERILLLEEELFSQLVAHLQQYVLPLQKNAQSIAELDCLLSFAEVSKRYNYSKPDVNDSFQLEILEGRHPVIERQMQQGEAFIPNDVWIDPDEQQVLIITGPNMSGKSAILRQTAIIVLMAQIGCFVPAKSAKIGIIDRIYTRVGASDNISSGESTFMVEMNETASILNNLSARSLILLDEIGRGTSTYDGISIAWSIVEFLHKNSLRPKTLFATHYHELNELTNELPRVKNYHVATQEFDRKVIFLRKLVSGGSEHSFGIHVAKMAGMPEDIITRSEEILIELESQRGSKKSSEFSQDFKITDNRQLSILQFGHQYEKDILSELKKMDISAMSPVECLLKLLDWNKKINNI